MYFIIKYIQIILWILHFKNYIVFEVNNLYKKGIRNTILLITI